MSGLLGNRKFYSRVLALAIPIMVQNGITNLVNMLDNIMVGRVGTAEMTGVAVTNQLIFVFNLCIFGAISGAGIFGAQYFGCNDHSGVRDTLRFKLIFCVLLTVAAMLGFAFFGEDLISIYLKGDGATSDAVHSLCFAREYLEVMLVGLIPYTIVQCYASTLREVSHPVLPMLAGMVSVAVNLSLNYVLIFGRFGAPALGVKGAAIATVIARFSELVVIVIWTHINHKKLPFTKGLYKSVKVPLKLVKNIFVKGMPLMVNETLWSAGIATVNQCYSTRGLDVVAANNISQTFFNVFSVAFMAVGVAIGIILGQMLGSESEIKNAQRTAVRLRAFSVFISLVVGVAFAAAAGFIPRLYNTTDSVKTLATALMLICAASMPMDAFVHASYFTLRSGGKVFITLLFDSCFVWAVSVPAAFMLSRFTDINIILLFAICQSLNLIKCVLGYIFVKRGSWIKNIVSE